MYGFRPARNRKHPGDPPPKWAPLGRTGRIVVLVTVIVGIVIALLIMTSRTAGAADSADGAASQPEPSSTTPWFGGRVEVPEHGFAVTVPDGWVGLDPAGDADEQVRVAVLQFDPDATVDDVRSSAETVASARREGVQLVLLEGSNGSSCSLTVRAKRAIETGEFAVQLASAMSSDDRWTGVEPPRAIELPAGPSFVISGSFTKLLSPLGPGPLASYLIDSDESVLFATCGGPERPDDDWLSIAETIEFLPAEE